MALLLMRWTSREGNRPLPPAGHTAAARAGAPRDARSGEGTGLTGREQGRAPCRLQSDGDGGDGVWFHGGRGRRRRGRAGLAASLAVSRVLSSRFISPPRRQDVEGFGSTVEAALPAWAPACAAVLHSV